MPTYKPESSVQVFELARSGRVVAVATEYRRFGQRSEERPTELEPGTVHLTAAAHDARNADIRQAASRSRLYP